MTDITEIAPDVFRISTFVAPAGLQFNQFLVRDDEPLLYHTGQNALFPAVRAAVASLVDVATLRWIGFSHFESDECGSLNAWLAVAPRATPLAGAVAAATCVNDFATRPARVLEDDATFSTGRHKFRFLVTPYVPHNWESSLLFDATSRTLFTSDLLLQRGDPAPTSNDVLTPALRDFETGQSGPFHDSIPWTPHTAASLERLAALDPATLAIMHGAAFTGDGAAVLRGFSGGLRRVLASTHTPPA
jgi:flavorubredoxin